MEVSAERGDRYVFGRVVVKMDFLEGCRWGKDFKRGTAVEELDFTIMVSGNGRPL